MDLYEEQGNEISIHREWYPECAEYFKHKEIMECLKNNPVFDRFFDIGVDENLKKIKEPVNYSLGVKTIGKGEILEIGLVLADREGKKLYINTKFIESYVGTFIKNQDGTKKKDENGNPIRFVNVEEAKAGLVCALERKAKEIEQYFDKDYWKKVCFKQPEEVEDKNLNRKNNDKISAGELADLLSSLCSEDVSDLRVSNNR